LWRANHDVADGEGRVDGGRRSTEGERAVYGEGAEERCVLPTGDEHVVCVSDAAQDERGELMAVERRGGHVVARERL